jgi:hypothetical protein
MECILWSGASTTLALLYRDSSAQTDGRRHSVVFNDNEIIVGRNNAQQRAYIPQFGSTLLEGLVAHNTVDKQDRKNDSDESWQLKVSIDRVTKISD